MTANDQLASDDPLDRPIPIPEVPALIEKMGYSRPHIGTVYRWIAARKLTTIRLGRKRYTTRRQIAERLIVREVAPSDAPPADSAPRAQANKTLEQDGM